jgi:hypothetical protein
MKTWLGALFAMAMVACGGGSSGPPDAGDADGRVPPDGEVAPPDAGEPAPDATPPDGEPADVCNPIAQTGCEPGEKCTTIRIDYANGETVTGCVPAGDVATGGACVYGPDGLTTGYDNCLGGDVCVASLCETICDAQTDSCDDDHTCHRYATVFDDGITGACDPLCNPVTQERYDGAAACGSPDATVPTRGCYGALDFQFACANVPLQVQTTPTSYQHEDTAYGPPSGGYYLNGCAPGYEPLITDAAGSVQICVAMCTPGPTSLEDAANADGLVGSGHLCADRGATTAGTECRYLWAFEQDPTSHPDGVGLCWTPASYDTQPCSAIAVADQTGLGCAPYAP